MNTSAWRWVFCHDTGTPFVPEGRVNSMSLADGDPRRVWFRSCNIDTKNLFVEWAKLNGRGFFFFFFILVTKTSSWKISGKSRRAKSEVPWLRRNQASEPCPRPTKLRWKDRESPRSQPQNSACVVLAPRTQSSPIISTWFCGPSTGLGRSISP